MARLFGRFQRLSAKPTAGEGSTGLGLSIVKRIVELHDGRVTADSQGPGLGSTFSIHLPAQQAQSQ
jgi:signal transduction histidine kinase